MLRLFTGSITRQLLLLTLVLLSLSTAVIVSVTYFNLSNYVMRSAVADAADASRTMAILYGTREPAAKVNVHDGALAAVTGRKIFDDTSFLLVDDTAKSINGVATIFEKRDSDYVRVSTNVKKENGERAVGTKLAADHPAQPVLAKGEPYYGPADLFGHRFMTGYFPVKDDAGANIGILFIGIPMEVYYANLVHLQFMVIGAGGIVMLLAGIAAYCVIRTSIKPLEALTDTVRSFSANHFDRPIPCLSKVNEFGEIGRALAQFRDNVQASRQLENKAAEQQAASEAERTRNEAEKQELDRQIDFAVSELAAGLSRLASGDVSRMLSTPFVGKLETLRQDFNRSLERLQATLQRVGRNAASIQRDSGVMLASAGELSKRTEEQAARLEETAAAVDEITSTVRASAARADEVNDAVVSTRKLADNSGAVVRDAVAAMDRIEQASSQIEQIIEVIDDIAFQTNLLALNAGIEAARAGETGKGFAVVAQEVRELAQRSADAARQIKQLIDKSSVEVKSGSELVQKAGEALSTVSREIIAISKHIETIAVASQDQSAALQEVNGAVNAMDQMTQKNASMVEEVTQASHTLANGAQGLVDLTQLFRFKTSDIDGAKLDAAA